MRFRTGNIMSLYNMDSLTTVSSELSRYRLDLVGLYEVKWEGNSTTPAEEYTFCYGRVSLHIRESYQQLKGLR
jgi:predicted DNA-binding ArsR family transcriptional regulator